MPNFTYSFTEIKRRPGSPHNYIFCKCNETQNIWCAEIHKIRATATIWNSGLTDEQLPEVEKNDFVRFIREYRPEFFKIISDLSYDISEVIKNAMIRQGLTIEDAKTQFDRTTANVLGFISGKNTEFHKISDLERWCNWLHIKIKFEYEPQD